MPVIIESRRKKPATIEKAWSGALILDVTSRGNEPWVRFSPFFPHDGIPIPNSPEMVGQSVEGIWQGLKVFEKEDIDPSRWEITDLKGIKRSGPTRGRVLGHRFGVVSLRLNPKDPFTHLYLGNWHYAQADYAAAIKEFRHAARLMPNQAVSFWCLADAYAGQGRVSTLR